MRGMRCGGWWNKVEKNVNKLDEVKGNVNGCREKGRIEYKGNVR